MIQRPRYLEAIQTALERSPVTALLGPRQCGKTTLARMVASSATFDLESVPDLRRLEKPEMVLGSIDGTIVIDEIQRMPALLEVLRKSGYPIDESISVVPLAEVSRLLPGS